MENRESAPEGAAREALEEAHTPKSRPLDLYTRCISIPQISQVY